MTETVTVRLRLTAREKRFILTTSYGSTRDSWVGRAIIKVATEGVEVAKGREGLVSTRMKQEVIKRLESHRLMRGLPWVPEGDSHNYLYSRIADVLKWASWNHNEREAPRRFQRCG